MSEIVLSERWTNAVRTAGRVTGLLVILAIMFIALCYMVLTISVNSGRISHLQRVEARLQGVASQISKDPKSGELSALQKQLADSSSERDSNLGTIEYGDMNWWGLPLATCAVPMSAKCLHKNASETNNLFLAMASGLIGACLYLLLGIYRNCSSAHPTETSYNLLAIITFLPMGMMVGLATLFAIRGTKGALLAPIEGMVQLENPYGIAFVTTVAAFASVRVLSLAAGIVDSIPNLWKTGAPAAPPSEAKPSAVEVKPDAGKADPVVPQDNQGRRAA